MDEPLGALNAMTRDELNMELLSVRGEGSGQRKTILFVTHSTIATRGSAGFGVSDQ
jgi:NitT/TauT family transport system ATP-binding protein